MAGMAILCRVNLPISVALVWITNPLTMPPMFYAAYYLGAHLLGLPAVDFELPVNWDGLRSVMATIGEPFTRLCPDGTLLIFGRVFVDPLAVALFGGSKKWRLAVSVQFLANPEHCREMTMNFARRESAARVECASMSPEPLSQIRQ